MTTEVASAAEHRAVPPGAYRCGLAFGACPHMCYGVPVAMGEERSTRIWCRW